MLTRLYIWLQKLIAIRYGSPWKDSTHKHGYVVYIGPIMVDWYMDEWKGTNEAVVSTIVEIVYDDLYEAAAPRRRAARFFIWLCKVATLCFGERWFIDIELCCEDHSLYLDKAQRTFIGWGTSVDSSKETRAYGKVFIGRILDRRQRKARYIRKPFMGSFAYEWQVMGLVMQVYYPYALLRSWRKWPRLRIWWDHYWKRF